MIAPLLLSLGASAPDVVCPAPAEFVPVGRVVVVVVVGFGVGFTLAMNVFVH